ncbi:MAG TPA: superoxide dismutase family protein [Longimicrobium sp.]|nr:superoxide dismutase family protein [Longimicrobium sp.]
MTAKRWMMAGGAVLALAACGPAPEAATARPRTYDLPLYDAQNQRVGTVTVTQQGRDSVRVTVRGDRLPPGTHGTHLHAVGKCEAPQFTTAGAHLNPANRQHGTRNPAGPHLGDLPNLVVVANGTGTLEATVAGTLTPGQAPLFDADGTALVVHASADDYMTDPSGNSGARIACAVIATPTT